MYISRMYKYRYQDTNCPSIVGVALALPLAYPPSPTYTYSSRLDWQSGTIQHVSPLCALSRKVTHECLSMQEVAKDIKIKQLPARSLNASLAITAVLNIAVFLPYLTHGRGGILMGPYLLLWAATLTTSLKYGFISAKSQV